MSRDAWDRYMRYRARKHADEAANVVVVNPSPPRNISTRFVVRRAHLKPTVVFAQVFAPPQTVRQSPRPSRTARAVSRRHRGRHPGDNVRAERTERSNDRETKKRRVVLCSGKIFTRCRRARPKVDDVALVRLEQLHPFPHDALAERLARFPNAEVVWAQEEPKNMGFWTFAKPRVDTALRALAHGDKRTILVGRPAAASPATGSPFIHARETRAVVDEALGREGDDGSGDDSHHA